MLRNQKSLVRICAVVVVIAVVGASYALVRSSHAAGCSVSATLVNSCRPWLGAAVTGYPQVASDKKSQALYHEQRIGRPLDIVHTYHQVGSNTLSSDEIYFATRANTYLYANWKPTSSWANIALSNAGIDSMANSIKSVAPNKIFLTVHHEPENDVTTDPNCPNVAYKGSYGTPTDYRNMWAYVENRFKADGVNNVVWAMNYMGYSAWDCLIPDMWPGNSLVDWVTWDAYSASDSSTFDNTVGRIYNLLTSLNDSTHNYESKTWGSAEWGDCKTADQAHVYQFYDQAKAALDSGAYPRLKMYMVYDDSGNNAGMGCLTEYSLTGGWDPTEQAHYNGFADDPRLSDSYYSPTPTPTPPATHTPAPITTPSPQPFSSSTPIPAGGSGAGMSGSDSGSGSITPPGASEPIQVDGATVPGTGAPDTTYLTNGKHTITYVVGGKLVTKTVEVHNKLNLYQTVRNVLFAGFHGNKTAMNSGMAALIAVLLIGGGLAIRKWVKIPPKYARAILK